MDTTGSFKITFIIKQKHGDLHSAIKARGWTNRQLAEFLSMNEQTVGKILNLKYVPPIERWSAEKKTLFLEKVMELTGKTFDDLFPPSVRDKEFLKGKKVAEISAEIPLERLLPGENQHLLQYPQEGREMRETADLALSLLEPRKRIAVEMHIMEGRTLEAVGNELKVTRSRARQIVLSALRTLRTQQVLDIINPDEEGTWRNKFRATWPHS
jgi:transcriptional regulator with XRE-family HTH domain